MAIVKPLNFLPVVDNVQPNHIILNHNFQDLRTNKVYEFLGIYVPKIGSASKCYSMRVWYVGRTFF